MDAVTAGQLDVLFIAPERLYDAQFLQRLADLPPGRLGFACVDEAHCISQWSHNFRPSYLRLDIVLRDFLGLRCVLGLTATATAQTELSVRTKLRIPKAGVWRSSTLRPNLTLTVSIEADRRAALVKLLRTPHYRRASSIIVYAFYRNDVDDLARFLQSKMLACAAYFLLLC
jgi:ATP-dependent DNA helicase Q4